MYERILVPTDGSEAALVAVERAIELAVQFDAVVDALFVVDGRFAATEYDMVVEELEALGEAALDDVAAVGAEREITVFPHLRRGTPHEEIVDAVDAYGADLVVMGTNGRTGFDRFRHLGSTTERVVRYSPVPVVTVPVGKRRREG